jgi:hypothetical protein
MKDNYTGDLFGNAFARHGDPDTSARAASFMRGEIANKLERRILNIVRLSPAGVTNHEIVALTGIPWNTCTPRMRPLVRKGYIIDTGKRKIGPTNRPCIIWKAVS